jgi:hypothetical protein
MFAASVKLVEACDLKKKGTCDDNENNHSMRRSVDVRDRSDSFSMGC